MQTADDVTEEIMTALKDATTIGEQLVRTQKQLVETQLKLIACQDAMLRAGVPFPKLRSPHD
jgi:hypothetical protein